MHISFLRQSLIPEPTHTLLLVLTTPLILLTPYQFTQLLVISVACALVELVPFADDNVTVPVAGAVLAALLLR